MANDRLFRELCKPETLKIGWHLAHRDSRDNFILDPIGFADFAMNVQNHIVHIINQIKFNRYRPTNVIDIEIPKSSLSVRPGNVLPIRDAVLLHAINFLIVPRLDSRLKREVYSYRLRNNWQQHAKKKRKIFREDDNAFPFLRRKTIREFDPIEPWYETWPSFQAEAARTYKSLGYRYLTKTDITSYFENIDLSILEARLRSILSNENRILEIMFRVLNSWTRSTSKGTPIGRGIPQGNDVSSVLGNIYLFPLDESLDRFCNRNDAKWMRYVDGVKVFTKNEKDAREVVFLINEELRRLHLSLQGSKTKIISGEDLNYEIDNSDFEKVKKVSEKLQKLDPSKGNDNKKITKHLLELRPLAKHYRRNLPESIRRLDWKQHRLLRRLLTVYGKAKRPYLLESAIHAIKEHPEERLLKSALRYLTFLQYKKHDELADELFEILNDNLLLFQYQIASVIEAFKDFHPANPKPIGTRIRQFALSSPRREWLIRQKALEAMTTFPYREDYAFSLAKRFLFDSHPYVKRAASLLLSRGPVETVRQEVEKLAYDADVEVGRIGLFWQKHLRDRVFVEKALS